MLFVNRGRAMYPLHVHDVTFHFKHALSGIEPTPLNPNPETSDSLGNIRKCLSTA